MKPIVLPLKYLSKNPIMRRFSLSKATKPGLPPGELVHGGEKTDEPVVISYIDYDSKNYSEKVSASIEQCLPLKKTATVSWINISGVHNTNLIEQLGQSFDLHPLLMEDIVNTEQRPKIEDFESYMFIVMRMLVYDDSTASIDSEQLSLVIGKNFVISFQEMQGDIFNSIRTRIKNSKGRFRRGGPDYLAYALIDAVVDHYFVILEKLGEKIEDLEEALALSPKSEYLPALHNMKREMIFLRKSVWPLREVISGIQRSDSKLIKKDTQVYLRDVYDHTIQVIDTVETFRDILSGMLDLYLSGMSNRMNEVMKVLTIFAAIFIPLTFIAGIYGMNFDNMPELHWKYGYFFALALMAAVGIGLLGVFKWKKWF